MVAPVSWRRRQYIVEGFQSRFIVTQLAWLAVFLLAVIALLFAPPVYALLTDPSEQRLDAALLFLLLHDQLWLELAILAGLAAVVTIRQSHRIAGPLYRLRTVCEQVAAGQLYVSARVRRGDYLTREADAFEVMLASLRARIGAAQAALTQTHDHLQSLPGTATLTDSELRTVAQLVAEARASLDAFEVTPPTDPHQPDSVPAPAAPVRAISANTSDVGGFSVLELLVVSAIIAVLGAISVPAYRAALETARVAKAIGDIKAFDREIAVYYMLKGCFPGTLADIGKDAHRDPWGRPYEFHVLAQKGKKNGAGACQACNGSCVSTGQARKDRALVPINSDFDLFSLGRDGKSSSSLMAKASRDDIVRGSDGAFVGLGENF